MKEVSGHAASPVAGFYSLVFKCTCLVSQLITNQNTHRVFSAGYCPIAFLPLLGKKGVNWKRKYIVEQTLSQRFRWFVWPLSMGARQVRTISHMGTSGSKKSSSLAVSGKRRREPREQVTIWCCVSTSTVNDKHLMQWEAKNLNSLPSKYKVK